jgi:hypothetical protein
MREIIRRADDVGGDVRGERSDAECDEPNTTGLLKRVNTSTGFQSVSLKMIVVADVTATPMNEYNAIVIGNPSA